MMFLGPVDTIPKAFDSFRAFWHDQMFQAHLVLFFILGLRPVSSLFFALQGTSGEAISCMKLLHFVELCACV